MKRLVFALWCAACATTKPVATPPPAAAAHPTCPQSRPETPGALDSVLGKQVALVCFIGDVKLRDVVSRLEGHALEADAVRTGLVELFATGLVRDAEAVATPVDAERVVLSYFVTPYPKLSGVRVEGAKAFAGDAVLDGLNPAEFAYANGTTLQALRGAVTDFYREHGYAKAAVTVALENGEAVLRVDEGALSSVTRIRFVGVKKAKEAELRAALSSKEGAVFQEDVAERDIFALNAVYFDRGMVKANVAYAYEGEELRFTVTEGDVFKLGRLSLSGYALSDGDAFLKSLESKKGDVFSRVAVQRDMKRLTERASKEGVRVNVTPLTDVDAAKKTIDVTFELEKLPGSVSF